jgi:hypothetical protein
LPQNPRRVSLPQIDADSYKRRPLIEKFFGKLKEYKRISMRADKADDSFKPSSISLLRSYILDESQQTLAPAEVRR